MLATACEAHSNLQFMSVRITHTWTITKLLKAYLCLDTETCLCVHAVRFSMGWVRNQGLF